MRRLIIFVFIGTLLIGNVTSKVHKHFLKSKWSHNRNAISDNEETKRVVCESKECKQAAKMLLNNMNRSVNPCEDFYEYSCGKWSKNNFIVPGVPVWNSMSQLQIKAVMQVREIVESKSTDNELRVVKLAKQWFKACMDKDTIEKRNLEPLISTLADIGGWPMTMESNEWNEQTNSWQKVDDKYMRLTGRNAFYDVRVKNDDVNVVEIDTPHLPPGSTNLIDDEDEDGEEDDEGGKSKSDEDPSNEEEQSEEDPEFKKKKDSIIIIIDENDKNECNDCDDTDVGSNSSGDGDDCGDDCDDADVGSGNNIYDDDDEDYMRKREKKFRKETSKKKVTGKLERVKNKKIYVKRSTSNNQIVKKNNKIRKQRLKKMTVPKAESKRAQRLNYREKSHAWKNEKNHINKKHTRRMNTILELVETTTSISNETNEEDEEDDEELIDQYGEYIAEVASIIARKNGVNISQEQLEKDVQDMVEFQINLMQIFPNPDLNNPVNMKVTLKDFQDWYDRKDLKTANSKIDWKYKIKALFDEANKPVDDNLSLDITSSEYVNDLISLLDKTSNRTIINYIHWNFISKVIKATTEEMKDLSDSWEQASKGSPSRYFYCLKSPEIKDILAYEFVRKYFSDDIMKVATNIVNAIQKEVEHQINQSDWMNSKAKDFALAKVRNIKKFIGYPDWYKNTTIIQEYYDGFVISPLHYENVLRYNSYTKWKSLRTVSESELESDVKKHLNPAEVNAFYMPWRNTMLVPAANFQNPWFSLNRPRSINFGSMGFIMAHEVNHGFDDTGHKYDKNGEFLGWLSAMAKSYDKKKECFVKQFNNYPIIKETNETIKDYGKQTTSDNIADTMGLQAIFKAYERSEKEGSTPDTTLPGMEDFSNNQLFFLSFANLWCEATDPKQIIEFAKTDEHSIGRLRIIGSVTNSEDFAKAFNCPANSPMNPEKKCNIWK
ncbi:hypothetical protein PUN28_020096 [Cardiocondyla obscurior]|uniref:Endothelin-converting enzyme 1 n=2 Tax=Cardiocondyla obscurior TaxID=286306 RepID=A0AAW2E7N4_9HYME